MTAVPNASAASAAAAASVGVSGLPSAVTGADGAGATGELQRNASFYASTWRGKVLLSLSIYKPSEREKRKKSPQEELKKVPIPRRLRPKNITILRKTKKNNVCNSINWATNSAILPQSVFWMHRSPQARGGTGTKSVNSEGRGSQQE